MLKVTLLDPGAQNIASHINYKCVLHINKGKKKISPNGKLCLNTIIMFFSFYGFINRERGKEKGREENKLTSLQSPQTAITLEH